MCHMLIKSSLLFFILWSDPVKEDRTIYDAFHANENRSASSGYKDQGHGDVIKSRSNQSVNKNKKRPEQNGKGSSGKHLSVEAGLAQVGIYFYVDNIRVATNV